MKPPSEKKEIDTLKTPETFVGNGRWGIWVGKNQVSRGMDNKLFSHRLLVF